MLALTKFNIFLVSNRWQYTVKYSPTDLLKVLLFHSPAHELFLLPIGLFVYLFIWGFTSLSTLYRSYHDG